METDRLPSTLLPFDWDVVPSGTDRYWKLAWALLAQQASCLNAAGITPSDRGRPVGTDCTSAVDLELGRPIDFAWIGGERFVPARSVVAIASASSPARLGRGTPVRLEDVIQDVSWEGMGTNYWSVERPDLGVSFLHSALEGRWGGAAILADHLIVPIDHPIVGDDARADRLVLDLQDITRSFRIANGLPAEGRIVPSEG